MTKPAQLEVFDFGTPLVPFAPTGQSDDWHEGHAVGLHDAHISAEAETGRLKAELVQALLDMQFGYAEAKADLLSQLAPLFDALIVGFLPRFSQESLVPRLREELTSLAIQSFDTPVQITVAPDQIVAVSDLLAETPQLPFTARADPSLGPGQAMISGGAQDQMIDLDGVLKMAQETLSALSGAVEERSNNG